MTTSKKLMTVREIAEDPDVIPTCSTIASVRSFLGRNKIKPAGSRKRTGPGPRRVDVYDPDALTEDSLGPSRRSPKVPRPEGETINEYLASNRERLAALRVIDENGDLMSPLSRERGACGTIRGYNYYTCRCSQCQEGWRTKSKG